jgi:hypothetical protein
MCLGQDTHSKDPTSSNNQFLIVWTWGHSTPRWGTTWLSAPASWEGSSPTKLSPVATGSWYCPSQPKGRPQATAGPSGLDLFGGHSCTHGGGGGIQGEPEERVTPGMTKEEEAAPGPAPPSEVPRPRGDCTLAMGNILYTGPWQCPAQRMKPQRVLPVLVICDQGATGQR